MLKMDKRGFTLVELMVVLAILGLLAGIGIPQYKQVMERAKIGRDVAAIATVQTAVTAFVTELGSWDKGTVTLIGEQGNAVLDAANGKSMLTGGNIKLSAFMDSNLPKLESNLASEAKWYISKKGTVYVSTDGNTVILPGSIPDTEITAP